MGTVVDGKSRLATKEHTAWTLTKDARRVPEGDVQPCDVSFEASPLPSVNNDLEALVVELSADVSIVPRSVTELHGREAQRHRRGRRAA